MRKTGALMLSYPRKARNSMLWFVLTVVMILAALFVVRPIYVGNGKAAGSEDSVYLAQLKEIDREETLGLVPAEDAKLARLEVKRRLANAKADTIHDKEDAMRRSDQFTVVGVVAVLALGSGILYWTVGSPTVLSSPHKPASRILANSGTSAARPETAAMPTGQNQIAPVDELLVRLEDRLALNPNDVEGWRMLGWSRFRMGDVEGARQAYKKAIDLDANDPDTLSAYGETLIRVAGGQISDEASGILERVLELNPTDARARFLIGLKKQQDGDAEAALEDWIALLASSSPGDDWRQDVKGRILELADQLGIDVSARLPADVSSDPLGPSTQDVAAASQMPEAERQAMIEGMVSRLDEKMKANPDDLDGWVRLIRARRVLGQEDQAKEALARAKAAFSGNATALQQLNTSATSPLGND
jgi:cytochrome c-type biogenesis protein CcmH